MYNKTVLKNGLSLITHAMPKMESVSVGVWVRVGNRHETRSISGIAHYLEHLVFKGSKKYSCRQIKELIEGVGGALNGFTSSEATCYFAKVPATKQFQALDILLDMTLNPSLRESDVKKEKTVILEEIKMNQDLPQSYVYELLDKILWPSHPLGMPILGGSGIISRLGVKDLRLFQRQRYSPGNIVVACCGNLKHKQILSRVRKAAGGFKISDRNTFAPVPALERKTKINILRKSTAQTHLALGCYGVDRVSPHRHIFSLLHVLLGANMSSRLFSEVRENKGLAYEIGTHIRLLSDAGIFLVRAGVDNNKVEEALRVIIKELAKIKHRLVSSAELARAKEFYIGQLKMSFEDTLEHMLWIGEPTLHLGKTYDLSGILKTVKEISPADLRRIAREVFKKELMRLAVIGPLKIKEEQLNACFKQL